MKTSNFVLFHFVPCFAFLATVCYVVPSLFALCAQVAMVAGVSLVSWTLAYAMYDLWHGDDYVDASGKMVLITGCDSGFGHTLAIRLNQRGFRVIAGLLDPLGEGALQLQKCADNTGTSIVIAKMDVTKREEVEAVIADIKRREEHQLWAVVNNAGVGSSGYFDWGEDVREYERTFQVNVFGLVRVSKLAMPLLRRTPGSRLVNVASLAARISSPFMSHYSMSKHAVRAFSDVIRRENQIAHFDVNVVTIEPTFYRTKIIENVDTSKVMDRLWEWTPEQTKQDYTESIIARQKMLRTQTNRMIRDNVDEVVDALERAVCAREPKLYYRCCGYTDIYIWAISHAPELILDFFLTK